MLKLSLLLTVLLVAGIHSDKFDAYRPKHSENHFSSGKHRQFKDEKNEESVSFKPVLQANGQPLPSPCTGFRAKTKIPHPFDKSKYIQCRDEFHYDVFACPAGTQYNSDFGACRTYVQIKDRCEEEKPCLNDGVCSILVNSTLKCTCGADWIGERCEIPVNSCVMKPCGPTGECRTLKTTNNEQDYICLCQNRREYGYNCQEVVPSPCISGEEIFFPFAFSTHAYIQCDGELIYFQSCGSLLYWNQEEKYCDRKRTNTVDASAISTKPAPNPEEESAASGMVNDDSEELTTLPPTKTTKMIARIPEPSRTPIQRPRIDSEPTINFVPNQQINRRPIAVEGPATLNNFPEQRFQDNQFMGRPKFEPSLPETTTRNIPIESTNEEIPLRPWQNPSRPDRLRIEPQFRFTTTTTVAPIAESGIAQSFMRGESFPQPQKPPRFNPNQQRFPETANVDRVPAVTNEERFPPVPSNRFRGEPTFPTTTTTFAPAIRENFFDSSSIRDGQPVQQQRFNPNQQRFSEATNVDRVPAVTNEERFPPVPSNRFRGETTFPTTTIAFASAIRENFFDSSSIRDDQSVQQQRLNSNQQRFPEATSVDRVPAVTNEERFPPIFANRFRGETTFPTTTTTLAPMIRENSFDSLPSRGESFFNQQQQQRFNPNQQRFPEATNVDRVPVVANEERPMAPFFRRFRGESSSTFTTTTMTTTFATMVQETVADSAPVQEEEQSGQPWFHKFNLQSSTQPTFKGGLIEPTTLAANIIRGSSFPAINTEEEEFARETTTTTTTPPSFPTRAWPTNTFQNPSWQTRPKQPSSMIDSSLLPQTVVRKNEAMENGETWSTSTEGMPFNQQFQQRPSNLNTFETNNLPSGEFPNVNTRRLTPIQNRLRKEEQNIPSQSINWKPRF